MSWATNKARALLFLMGCIASTTSCAIEESGLVLKGEALEAVNAGVILSFTNEYAQRKPWGPFTRTLDSRLHRFVLTRHALSNRYIVKLDTNESPNMFRSVDEAVLFITQRSQTLLESYSSAETPYSMRLTLNKYELPAPMRLKAFIADEWDIDTGWINWTSAN